MPLYIVKVWCTPHILTDLWPNSAHTSMTPPSSPTHPHCLIHKCLRQGYCVNNTYKIVLLLFDIKMIATTQNNKSMQPKHPRAFTSFLWVEPLMEHLKSFWKLVYASYSFFTMWSYLPWVQPALWQMGLWGSIETLFLTLVLVPDPLETCAFAACMHLWHTSLNQTLTEFSIHNSPLPVYCLH